MAAHSSLSAVCNCMTSSRKERISLLSSAFMIRRVSRGLAAATGIDGPIARGLTELVPRSGMPLDGRDCTRSYVSGAEIMKKLARAQLFVAPNRVRRAEARLERGMSAVVAARERAVEITQRQPQPFRTRPTVLMRRRLAERLKAVAMV